MKNYKKVIAGIAAAVVSAGATTSIAFAMNRENDDKETTAVSQEAPADTLTTGTGERKDNGSPAFKDETVYVVCNADSDIKHIIVSDWLKNAPAYESIKDVSSLTNIENVKGDEEFTLDGTDLTWNAGGHDIYYKGNCDKELPVDVKMKYFLDGKEVSPSEITGKSGHLVIRWEYTVNAKIKKTIDGKEHEMNVPFIAASTAILNSEKFVNASISSGKVLSDGNRLIVAGVALPGLNESLGLDKIETLDLDLPEYIEFSADVIDFEPGLSVTAVSNEIFSNLDMTDQFSFGNIKGQFDELINGANELTAGTVTLSDGLSELSKKSGDLTDGAKKLRDGADDLSKGAKQLSEGTSALSDGAKKLSDSTGSFKSGLQSAKDGAKKIADGSEKLAAGSSNLKTGADNLSKGAQELSAGLGTAGSSLDTTIAANEQVLAAMEALYAQSPSPELAKVIETLKTTIAGQKQISASLNSGGTLNNGAAALQKGAAQISSGAVDLNKGLGDVKAGAGSLDSGLGQLLTGSTQLSEGTLKIYQSSAELSKGAAKVADGAASLFTGASSLYDGIVTYTSYVAQLSDGALKIKAGMSKFNDEGIAKISAAVDEKLPTIIENFKTVREISKEYKSYSGISDDMNGSVKFIYMFDGTSFREK